eukprot:TRINITY_DN1452_c3_g1_i1.p1 TRINITY_DN1452_c3_g1~~TRINITY_DN1452_c3_g1_i1.p1  ORF type:complete len:154 (+),score=75.49 TRINITY_DN1452_c3_g1_i1:69-464(+)
MRKQPPFSHAYRSGFGYSMHTASSSLRRNEHTSASASTSTSTSSPSLSSLSSSSLSVPSPSITTTSISPSPSPLFNSDSLMDISPSPTLSLSSHHSAYDAYSSLSARKLKRKECVMNTIEENAENESKKAS